MQESAAEKVSFEGLPEIRRPLQGLEEENQLETVPHQEELLRELVAPDSSVHRDENRPKNDQSDQDLRGGL